MLLRQVETAPNEQKFLKGGSILTCYHPKLRIEMIGKTEKAEDGHLYHPAIIIPADKESELLEKYKDFHANYRKQIIPCRNCIGCRLDYSREWANRGYLESKKSEDNYFITLTYDEEHLPIDESITTSEGKTYTRSEEWKGNLRPEHLKKFIHDIRQYFYRKNKKQRIKYLACGEYGTENKRPHYHIILFDCPFTPNDMYNPRIIDKEIYYQNRIIEKYWKRGLSNVTVASWNTIAYVARYVTKKQYGHNAEDERAQKGQIAEFIRVSNGIGKEYWEQNKEKILKTDSITIKNGKGVHTTKPPRYFYRLLQKENREAYEDIKKRREQQNDNTQKARDRTHTYGRLGELENQERTKIPQAGTLRRDL